MTIEKEGSAAGQEQEEATAQAELLGILMHYDYWLRRRLKVAMCRT